MYASLKHILKTLTVYGIDDYTCPIFSGLIIDSDIQTSEVKHDSNEDIE